MRCTQRRWYAKVEQIQYNIKAMNILHGFWFTDIKAGYISPVIVLHIILCMYNITWGQFRLRIFARNESIFMSIPDSFVWWITCMRKKLLEFNFNREFDFMMIYLTHGRRRKLRNCIDFARFEFGSNLPWDTPQNPGT